MNPDNKIPSISFNYDRATALPILSCFFISQNILIHFHANSWGFVHKSKRGVSLTLGVASLILGVAFLTLGVACLKLGVAIHHKRLSLFDVLLTKVNPKISIFLSDIIL